MKRRFFHIATAISLLISLATLALWVRSYWVSETIEWTRPALAEAEWSTRFSRVYVGRGLLRVECSRTSTTAPHVLAMRGDLPTEATLTRQHAAIPKGDAASQLLNFEWIAGPLPLSTGYQWDGWIVGTPLWVLMVVGGLLPLWWLVLWQRMRRRPRALCPACGYDVRASPGRCPECGTEATTGAVTPNK